MKKSVALIFVVLTSAVALSQYSKYDVIDYFRLIPLDHLQDSFLDVKVTEKSDEERREDILEWGLNPPDPSIRDANDVVDVKNGYISHSHYYIQNWVNEFVVWKAKNKEDIIGISTRLDFKSYRYTDKFSLPVGFERNFYGLEQNLVFYTYVKGRFIVTDYFIPEKSKLLALARRKFYDLKKDPYPKIVFILPRSGTKVRIANYIIPNIKGAKPIVRDFASLIWNGTELKFSEKP
jgi:hypothetical protein